jgi:uridylate kinase
VTFKDALDRDLQIMDRTAFTLCMENDMPILVFDMFVPGNLERAVRGEDIGTWVVSSYGDSAGGPGPRRRGQA